MLPHITVKVAIFQDIENVNTNFYESALALKKSIRASLGTPCDISYFAYGNSNKVNEITREQCCQAGVSFIEVADSSKSAADRSMMLNIFRFIIPEEAPLLVFLVTGDGDFITTVEAIKRTGCTAVVVAPKRSCSLKLLRAADFFYHWENVAQLGLSGPVDSSQDLHLLKPCPRPHIRDEVAIFWDNTTCSLPKGYDQQLFARNHVLDHLTNNASLRRPRSQRPALYRIYGDVCGVSMVDRVQYIQTSKEVDHKEYHLENLMLPDILSFAYDSRHTTGCTILVVTGNVKFSGLLHFLDDKGYNIILWVPDNSSKLLTDAVTKVSKVPDWIPLHKNKWHAVTEVSKVPDWITLHKNKRHRSS